MLSVVCWIVAPCGPIMINIFTATTTSASYDSDDYGDSDVSGMQIFFA
jgi:hypothetical protein